MIQGFFADKGKFPYGNTATALEASPALAGYQVGLLSIILSTQLGDSDVRHVRPIFVSGQGFTVELIVQVTQLVGFASDANEDGGGYRDKSLDFVEGNFEGFDAGANFF
jgi:hypothetical protein